MKESQETGPIRQVAAAELPTPWGVFRALGFERRRLDQRSPETAILLVLGEPSQRVPLVRIHSQCVTDLFGHHSERADELELDPMAPCNICRGATAFTVSIDLIGRGVTTGISAHDRAQTILVSIDPQIRPADLGHPGHVFLCALAGTESWSGVVRLKHRSIWLVFAGLEPAGVICEIMNEDGTMARVPDLIPFCVSTV